MNSYMENSIAFYLAVSLCMEDSLKRITALGQALSSENLEEMRNTVHTMKPSLPQLASKTIQYLNMMF